VFVAAIVLHLCRIFFTGAYRKPRDVNYYIGLLMLMLAILEGFAGYSLPDDLLSGLGLRIADSVLLSVPFVGTWASFLLLGGAFPSPEAGPRLFVAHVYILPAAIAALIALHVAIVWRQKHTEFPGAGRSEDTVAGSPLVPNYALRSLALASGVIGVIALLGGVVQINPVWLYGPYIAWQAISPAQPDWYLGWVEGALRLGPAWAVHLFGHMIPAPFWPGVVLPATVIALLFAWPALERFVTGDGREHHLLDRPRDCPARTAAGAAMCAFAAVLTFAGSDDVQARYTYLSVVALTQAYRVALVVVPLFTALIAYFIAVHLLREGGGSAPRVRVRRAPSGGFEEESIR